MKNFENTFTVSGFVSNDAVVKSFETASIARFSIAVSRGEKKDGKTEYTSAFINIEAWKKKENTKAFDILKKGNNVTIKGFFKPEEWTDTNGTKKNRIIFTATDIFITPDKE